jgi:hypothetical protein
MKAARQLGDALGVGGREQQGLALAGQAWPRWRCRRRSPCPACGRLRPAPGCSAPPDPGCRAPGGPSCGRACPPRRARRAPGWQLAAQGTPPHRVTTLMLSSARARRRISCVTWSASSRVGHSTSACTAKRRGFRLASRASAKAAVLPLPVLAWAIRSLPASASGRLAAWIGVIAGVAQALQVLQPSHPHSRHQPQAATTGPGQRGQPQPRQPLRLHGGSHHHDLRHGGHTRQHGRAGLRAHGHGARRAPPCPGWRWWPCWKQTPKPAPTAPWPGAPASAAAPRAPATGSPAARSPGAPPPAGSAAPATGLVGHQRVHQQASAARTRPLRTSPGCSQWLRKLVQRLSRAAPAAPSPSPPGRRPAGWSLRAQHPDQVGQQQGDFGGHAGIARAVAGIGHHAQRRHKRGTSRHQRTERRSAPLPRPRLASVNERTPASAVGPLPLRRSRSMPISNPQPSRTGQHGQRGRKTLQILHGTCPTFPCCRVQLVIVPEKRPAHCIRQRPCGIAQHGQSGLAIGL